MKDSDTKDSRQFLPNSDEETGELDVPVNNTNTAQPQVLQFEARNEQYYFAKRQISGGTPTGCVLYILECGIVIGSIDIDSLTSDYEAFNSTGYIPCSVNYTLQFIETCSNTGGVFPTLDLANLTLFEAAGSSAQTSVVLSAASGGATSTPSTTSTSSLPVGTGITCPQNNGTMYTDPSTGEIFMIDCYVSYADNDITNNYQYNLAGCISACAALPSCSAVNWLVGLPEGPCYLKSSASLPGVVNLADYAAYLVSTANSQPTITSLSSVSIISVPSQTAAPSSSPAPSTSTTLTSRSESALGSITVITSEYRSGFGFLPDSYKRTATVLSTCDFAPCFITTTYMSTIPCTTCASVNTITITQSTCSPGPRGTTTVFATATVTSCPAPLTCPFSSGLPAPSTSSASVCSSTIVASFCQDCALTPTVIISTCTPATTSSGTSVASGNPTATIPTGASSSTPNCPYEPEGRLFVDYFGFIYALYCGTEFLDPTLDTLNTVNLTHCIAACDTYNIQNYFDPSDSCKGISFYENTVGNNCYLKNSTNDPQEVDGADSGILLNPQPPPGNMTTIPLSGSSAITTGPASTAGSGTGAGGGSGTGSGSGPGTGPGTGAGTGPGTGLGTGAGTGPGTGPGTGAGTGPGTGPGTEAGTGPGTGPGTGSGTGVLTITQGTGPGTGPASTVYSVSTEVITTVSISTIVSVTTATATVTSVSTAITTISGSATTIVSSVLVPATSTQSITTVSSVLVTQTQEVTITAPPVTVTGSGGNGGGTVYITIGGGSSSSSSFVCHSTPVSYLKRKKKRMIEPLTGNKAVLELT